ncbi:MAG: hypothetical protein IKA17_00330 [Clostridia bacterium]|nr:hypothetical protein [Clostridia bacterium]
MKKFEKIGFVLFVFIIAAGLFGAEIDFGKYDEIVRFIILVLFGIICLGSGLLKWKFWGIRSGLREGKYGEEFNTIVMTLMGVIIIILAFQYVFFE